MAPRTLKPANAIKKANGIAPKNSDWAFAIDDKLWRLDYTHLTALKYHDTIHTIVNIVLYNTILKFIGITEGQLEKWKKETRLAGKTEDYRTIKMGEMPMFAYSTVDQNKYQIAKITISSIHGPKEVTVSWPVIEIFGEELDAHQKNCGYNNSQKFHPCHNAFLKEKTIEILGTALNERERTIRMKDMKIEGLMADFKKLTAFYEEKHQNVVNEQMRKLAKVEEERDDARSKLDRCVEVLRIEREVIEREAEDKLTNVQTKLREKEAKLQRSEAELEREKAKVKETDAELKKERAKLKKTEAELKKQNAKLKESNAEMHLENQGLHQHVLSGFPLPLMNQQVPLTGVVTPPSLPLTPMPSMLPMPPMSLMPPMPPAPPMPFNNTFCWNFPQTIDPYLLANINRSINEGPRLQYGMFQGPGQFGPN